MACNDGRYHPTFVLTSIASTSPSKFEDDYAQAVIHLVWDLERSSKVRTLLCGAVELLPKEVPAPIELPERCQEISGKHRLYSTARVVPAQVGLSWFEDATLGHVIRPRRDESILPICSDSPTFGGIAFYQEPPSPQFVSTSLHVPFSADWHYFPRVRHLVARDFSATTLWSTEEFERARAWLKEEMQFDWNVFPEYWGSLHLIAPNPVFRGFDSRIERTDGIVLVVAFELRAGKSVEGLEFEIESRRPTGTSFVVRRALRAEIERIPLPCEPEEMFERVHDQARGLLYKAGPFFSNETFSLTINLASETRSVSIPRANGSSDAYEVSLTGGFSFSSKVGEERPGRDGAMRLREARTKRAKRNRGAAEQKWFRNQVSNATEELRVLVGRVSGRLFVVDPYFEGDDLLRVLLAVSDPTVPIEVLLGADHLRSPCTLQGIEHGDHLANQLATANATGRMNPVEMRVMRGAVPAIHNRFLHVGSELWMLGSSLNAFGTRGTLMVKVPDPEPVLRDLRTIWDECRDLEFFEWLAERHRQRGSQA